MNILFISSSRGWGGGETWLTQIHDGLQTRGHRVVIVCQPDSEIRRRLNATVSDLIPMKLSGDFNPISIVKLYRVIKRYNIDLICTNMEKELRLGGVAAILAGIPIVPSREVDVPIKNTWINRFYYRHITSGVIVNSHATLNTLLMSAPWLEKERIEVVWKGVDVERYATIPMTKLKHKFHFSQDDCVVGFIGRLDEQKGIPTLLVAMKNVVARNPHVRLIMAGDGNLRESIECFRKENSLENHIVLAGFCEDIPAFVKEIDFLVMPSYWEGFGYAAAEAMAAGKAVVGTHTSSLPEIIDDGRTGLLVSPRSDDQLADAIVTLATHHTMRESMGNAGARKVKNQFTLASMIMKTETVFHRISEFHRKNQKQKNVRLQFLTMARRIPPSVSQIPSLARTMLHPPPGEDLQQ